VTDVAAAAASRAQPPAAAAALSEYLLASATTEYGPSQKRAARRAQVYVHCFAGVSRAPATVAAHLVYELGLDLEVAPRCFTTLHPAASRCALRLAAPCTRATTEQVAPGRQAALKLVRRARPFVRPNSGFMRQLEEYSDDCAQRRQRKSLVKRHVPRARTARTAPGAREGVR
jgi:hypothetical protein